MADPTPELDKKGEKVPIKYVRPDGPSEFIASPVFHDGKVYAAIGQDPEHGEGLGNLVCIDAKSGEQVWQYPLIHRAISTCAITGGRVYVADYSGYIYCFDALTGELHWRHYTWDHVWASPLIADGKLIIGTDGGLVNFIMLDEMNKLAESVDGPMYSEIKIIRKDGERFSHLFVRNQAQIDSDDRDAGEQLPVERTEQIVREIDMGAPVNSSAVVANDVLYIGTKTHLYAIEKKQ
jgi:outer membrane protein assembly factor BamB